MINFKELREKTLTPAEKKKREEIAKAIEKDDPKMPMDKKMAIATATAKRVAEGFTPKEIKMAIGVASDKRYAGGNYTGAVKAIEKIKKGLSKHSQVAAVLRRQNESTSVEEKRDAGKSATGYDIYHDTYSAAMQHAYAHAKKKHGVTVRPSEIDDKVALGPKKPSIGKTVKHILKTDSRKNLHVQVYNTGRKYELNMYVESVNEASLNEAVAMPRKQFDTLRKGDKVTITYDSSIRKGTTTTFVVKGKSRSAKYNVDKITMHPEDKPSGMKYYLYSRDGKDATLALGDMGATMTKIVKEAVSPAQQAAIAISKKEKGEKPVKEEKVECPKCKGDGCSHCENKGYHLESARSMAMRDISRDKDFQDKDDEKDVKATDDDRKAADKNIIMQIRRVSDLPKGGTLEFKDGKKVKISQKIAKQISDKFNSIRKPQDKKKFQDMAQTSMNGLKQALRIR